METPGYLPSRNPPRLIQSSDCQVLILFIAHLLPVDILHFRKVDTRHFVTLEAFTALSTRLGLSHLLFTINLRGRWYFCLCRTGVYLSVFSPVISEKRVAQKIKWPVQCHSSTIWWEMGNLTKELVQLMVQYTILFPSLTLFFAFSIKKRWKVWYSNNWICGSHSPLFPLILSI